MSLDLVTRLFLDTENYDKNLEKSKKNLTSFENQCKTYGNTISNFAPKIGNLISVAGKLSPAFVAAGVGMGVFNSKMKTSESFADSFNSALKQSEAGLSELQRRIFSLDFGNLISGFEDASNQAKRLYNAVDNLGTLKLFSGPGHKENLVNLQDAANRYREARTKGDTKGMTSAKKDYEATYQKEARLIKKEIAAQREVLLASSEKISNRVKRDLANYKISFKPSDKYVANFLKDQGKFGFLGYLEMKNSQERNFHSTNGKAITFTEFAELVKTVVKNRERDGNKYLPIIVQELKRHGFSGDLRTFLMKYLMTNYNEDEYFKDPLEQAGKLADLEYGLKSLDKDRQKVYKDGWKEDKKNTVSTSKSAKTYKEAVETFESIINRMRSSNNLASSQYKEGFMSQVEYYSALKSNLDSAIKGLMSDKIWTTLTDAQKQELQSMQKTSSVLENFLNEYRNQRDKKDIDTNLSGLSDMYTNLDILKNGRKSVFFGRLENSEGLTDEGATNQVQRNISDHIYDLYLEKYGTKLPDYNNGELAEILTDGRGIFTYLSDEAQEYYNNLDIYTKKKLDSLIDDIKRGLSNVTAFSSDDAFEFDETLFYQQNPSANRRDYLEAYISAAEKVRLKFGEDNKGYQSEIDKLKKEIANREDLYVTATIDLDETAKQRLLDEINELDKKIGDLQDKINRKKLRIETNDEGVKNAKEEIDELDKQKKQVQDFSDAFSTVSYAFSTAGDAAEEFGNESAGTALKMVGIGAQLAASIANIIGMTLTEAGANAVNSASKIGYPQNIIAIGSALAAVMAAAAQVHSLGTKKYAHGGIVEGIGSSFSDSIPIMVSNGEMVLNKGQQRNLFNLLDRGEGVPSLSNGDVTFRIKGNVMEGTLKNHNSQMRKIR